MRTSHAGLSNPSLLLFHLTGQGIAHQLGNDHSDGARKLYRAMTQGLDAATLVMDARSFRDAELPGVLNPTDPFAVISREPRIVSQFTVAPKLTVGARLVDSTLVINGTNDRDRISVDRRFFGNELVVKDGHQVIGRFDARDVDQINILGLGGND